MKTSPWVLPSNTLFHILSQDHAHDQDAAEWRRVLEALDRELRHRIERRLGRRECACHLIRALRRVQHEVDRFH